MKIQGADHNENWYSLADYGTGDVERSSQEHVDKRY